MIFGEIVAVIELFPTCFYTTDIIVAVDGVYICRVWYSHLQELGNSCTGNSINQVADVLVKDHQNPFGLGNIPRSGAPQTQMHNWEWVIRSTEHVLAWLHYQRTYPPDDLTTALFHIRESE